MPSPKSSRKKSSPPSGQDTYTAQLTSGQLVIGVCILIVFGLACFMLGVLVGKFEPSPRPDETRATPIRPPAPAAAAPSAAKTSVEAKTPAPAASKKPGDRRAAKAAAPPKTATPRPSEPVLGGKAKAQSKPSSGGASAKVADKPQGPRPVDLPEPPPARAPPSRKGKAVASKTSSEKGLGLIEPRDETSTPGTTAEKVAPRTKREELPPPVAAPRRPAPPTMAAPSRPSAPTPPVSPKLHYAVQVGAFGKRQNAEAAKARIESLSAHVVELSDTASGKYVIVVVGDFADRAKADKARIDLRDRLGFRDCFVRARHPRE